jgi:hypothetical protein
MMGNRDGTEVVQDAFNGYDRPDAVVEGVEQPHGQVGGVLVQQLIEPCQTSQTRSSRL